MSVLMDAIQEYDRTQNELHDIRFFRSVLVVNTVLFACMGTWLDQFPLMLLAGLSFTVAVLTQLVVVPKISEAHHQALESVARATRAAPSA